MTQAELNREVAEATGESVREIEHRGFTLLTPVPIEREPHIVDWDEVQAERRVPVFPQRGRALVA